MVWVLKTGEHMNHFFNVDNQNNEPDDITSEVMEDVDFTNFLQEAYLLEDDDNSDSE